MNINPYEPPRDPQPKGTMKRAFGVGAIILLTPLAVLIAGGLSCAASLVVLDSPLVGQSLDSAIIVGLSVFLGPPVLVLIAMVWWAIKASQDRGTDDGDTPTPK